MPASGGGGGEGRAGGGDLIVFVGPGVGKIWKSWRPTRTSKSWVDFTVLSSNFVCFSLFLIN